MATADASAGDGGPQRARDFVQEKLREVDSAMSPAELAEEYGCTNGHIRNLLSDLRKEGAVERVAHGQYEAAVDGSGAETADLLADMQAESEGNAKAETDGKAPDETAQETPEVVDGPARSEGRDTTAGDRESDDGTSGSGSFRIPVPVSSELIVVSSVLLVVLVFLWKRSKSSSEPEQPQEDEQDDEIAEGAGWSPGETA